MPRVALATAISGAVLLVGAPAVWHLSQPADTVGDVPVAASGADADAGGRDPGETGPVDAGPGDVAAFPPTTALTIDPDLPALDVDEPAPPGPAVDVVEPVGLGIDAIGVDAPVVPVGLNDDRSMEIPHDISTLGWYEPGVMPGETGTAVLSGHVDSRTQGRGAFFDLRKLDVDDIVTVDHADGATSDWRVTARTVYAKDELPIADIFTRFGDTRMVLITCGGAFDNTTRHYEDNVVVYTEPVGGDPAAGRP